MNPLKTIKYFFNKIIMALTYKKLSELTDMTAGNIDTTTKLVVTTGVSKTNNNLKVSDLIVDDLVTSNSYSALSAKMGKKLQDEKAPIANPTFTGTVSGITKSMVGLGNVDNTSDANKPVSTAQANTLAPKANPVFTGAISTERVIATGDSGSNVGGGLTIEGFDYDGALSSNQGTGISFEKFTDEAGIYIKGGGFTAISCAGKYDTYGQLTIGFRGHGLTTNLKGDVVNIQVDSGDIILSETDGLQITYPIQTFADNTAAAALATGTVYKTSTGVLMIKY